MTLTPASVDNASFVYWNIKYQTTCKTEMNCFNISFMAVTFLFITEKLIVSGQISAELQINDDENEDTVNQQQNVIHQRVNKHFSTKTKGKKANLPFHCSDFSLKSSSVFISWIRAANQEPFSGAASALMWLAPRQTVYGVQQGQISRQVKNKDVIR